MFAQNALEYAEKTPEQIRELYVAETIHKTRLEVSKVFHMPTSQQTMALISLCTSMARFSEVIELACTKQLSKAVIQHAAKITPTHEELSALLAHAATKAHKQAEALVSEPLFQERAARVQKALQFTISEASGTAAWKLPMVKIACVVAFQAVYPPTDTLNTIFGSVVRSDLRRCEDLHECETKNPIDTMLFGDIVQIVSEVLVLV